MKLSDFPYIFSGVYYIKNTKTNKVYIGCSVNVGQRLGTHINDLVSGRHTNKEMQADFVSYGLDSFECGVLERCLEDETYVTESFWVYELSKDHELYNRKTVGGNFYSVLRENEHQEHA